MWKVILKSFLLTRCTASLAGAGALQLALLANQLFPGFPSLLPKYWDYKQPPYLLSSSWALGI